MHHAASQSTLNLEMRSPFIYQQSTPNSMMTKVCSGAEASASHNAGESITTLLRKKPSRLGGRCNSTQLSKGGSNSGVTTAPRKYQTSYNNYINGEDCDDEVMIKRTEMSDSVKAGKKSAGELGKSGGFSGRQLFVAKSKSQSCLGGAVTAVRPASSNLYKRNQETALSRPQSTKMTTVNEVYSQFTSTANSRVQTALQASRSEKQVISAGAWSQRTSNMNKQVKTQRSNQNQSMTSSKYLTKMSTARGSAQAATEAPSSAGNVVLSTDNYQPSYMKPIQQKFKKQTIRMVQEREKENGMYGTTYFGILYSLQKNFQIQNLKMSYIPSQAEIQACQQNPAMLAYPATHKDPPVTYQNQLLQKNTSQGRLGLKSASVPYL